MASSYTDNSGIELIGVGEQSGTWGTTTNNNLEIIDKALNGVTDITVSGDMNIAVDDGDKTSNGHTRVLKLTGGNSKTLLGTISSSEIPSSSSVITMARFDGRIYVLVNNGSTDSLKFTVSASDFDDTSNMAVIWGWGRGSSSSRSYMNAGYRANMTEIIGVPTLTTSATGSFEGNPITASSTNKMGAVITYQDNAGTNALNTDIVLKLSADNGSNYSTATLTALPDFATGIKIAKVNDLSVTAGTQLKYKLEFANQASGSKEARIRGVSLQY